MRSTVRTGDSKPEPSPATTSDPIEVAMEAVVSGSVPDSTARNLLLRQTRLIEMQIQQIRLRRWLTAVLTALLLLGVASVLWSASRDRSLVIDAFSAPPDLEAQGLGGEVLASLLLDKLSTMDQQTDSLRARATLRNDWSGDIKVQIPDTGLSIGQVQRGLREWLGHQTRVEGSVFHRGDQLVLTVRTEGGVATEFAGAPAALDRLLQQGAEAVYSATQPDQFSKYLEEHGRPDEALAEARKAAAAGSDRDRAWAYAQICNLLYTSDMPGAVDAARKAIALDPGNALAYLNLSGAETLLGHDEDGWRDLRRGAGLAEAGGGGLSDTGVLFGLFNTAVVEEMGGNFTAALAILSNPKVDIRYSGYTPLLPGLKAVELARLHDVSGAAAIAAVLPDTDLIKYLIFWNLAYLPAYERDAALEDWPAALADLDAVTAATTAQGYLGEFGRQRFVQPLRAMALAHLGRIAEARQAAGGTPTDCYICVRARGQVEAMAGDASAADRWFGEALRQGPSLSIAYFDWGRAKLARGDTAGAIALLRQAQQKAPAWADPLKAEGDALMRLNQAANALDRYAAAAQRAPRWGGLLVAWGQALDALGRKAEAREKYVAAAGMDLSAADRATVQALSAPPR